MSGEMTLMLTPTAGALTVDFDPADVDVTLVRFVSRADFDVGATVESVVAAHEVLPVDGTQFALSLRLHVSGGHDGRIFADESVVVLTQGPLPPP